MAHYPDDFSNQHITDPSNLYEIPIMSFNGYNGEAASFHDRKTGQEIYPLRDSEIMYAAGANYAEHSNFNTEINAR